VEDAIPKDFNGIEFIEVILSNYPEMLPGDVILDDEIIGKSLSEVVLAATEKMLLQREFNIVKADGADVCEVEPVSNPGANNSVDEQKEAKIILPKAEEILDSLGLGPAGPPIQPETMFRIVRYPEDRKMLKNIESNFCKFKITTDTSHLLNSGNSPSNLDVTETGSSAALELNTNIDAQSVKTTTSTKKSSGKQSTKNRKTSANTKTSKASKTTIDDDEEGKQAEMEANLQSQIDLLKKQTRWVLEPGKSITICVKFTSENLGQFDETLSFEIVSIWYVLPRVRCD